MPSQLTRRQNNCHNYYVGSGKQPISQVAFDIYRICYTLRLTTPSNLSTGIHVDQAQLEIQLKVWKELAISKQMLMRTAAEALGLDANCNQDELKAALDAALQKVKDADASVVSAKHQAQQSINEMEKKLLATQRAQSVAETETANMRAAQEKAAPQLAAERAAVAKEIQQLKNAVSEREKAIKAINTALADTPDNVVKKMKSL